MNREWKATRYFLRACFMVTIFGSSAPVTDVEAIALLKELWGDVSDRVREQTEVIGRTGGDRDQLREKWDSFIQSHHYDIFDDFFSSWMACHPHRSGEAYALQFWDKRSPSPRIPYLVESERSVS